MNDIKSFDEFINERRISDEKKENEDFIRNLLTEKKFEKFLDEPKETINKSPHILLTYDLIDNKDPNYKKYREQVKDFLLNDLNFKKEIDSKDLPDNTFVAFRAYLQDKDVIDAFEIIQAYLNYYKLKHKIYLCKSDFFKN